MGWTIFTVVDLFIGLFLLDGLAPTLPQEKLPRLRAARKVILGLLIISGIVLVVQIAQRHGWMRH